MTRKDYRLIAMVLYNAPGESEDQWRRVVNDMAEALAKENPRFDRERFIKACETGKD